MPNAPRDRSACCACPRWATPPTSCRWCARCSAPGRRCDSPGSSARASGACSRAWTASNSSCTTRRPGWPACARCAARSCSGRRFDVLLQMQVAARANLLSAFMRARRRDRLRPRAHEGTARPVRQRAHRRPPGIHVLDAIGSFCEPLGPAAGRRRAGTCRCPTTRRNGRARNGPTTARRRCWSRPAPATRCATGAPSATPPSPTTPPRAAGAWCCAAAAASWSARTADAILAAMRQPGARPGRQGHAQAAAGAARTRRPAADPGFRADAHRQRDGHQGAGPARGQQPGAQRAVLRPALLRGPLRRGRAQVPRQAGGGAALGHQDRAAA